MGRLAVIEKSVEPVLESSCSNWNIGLLIGLTTEQKDYVLHYANTPMEAEDRDKGLTNISDVLVSSHAAELHRMLPGGLCVCGIAVIASGAELNNSSVKLQQIMLATYKKLKQVDVYGCKTDTWHLLMFDQHNKKLSSKSLDVSNYKNTLKPSETRFQQLNTGWVIAETSLQLDKQFYIGRHQEDQHFEQQLFSGISPFLNMIDESVCLIDGKMLEEDSAVGETGKGKKSATQLSDPIHVNVQLLGKLKDISSSSSLEVISSITLVGTISSISFLKAPASSRQIAQAVKSDLKKSITVRCQLLCEDILQVGSEKHAQEEQVIYETPPRVYIPHSSLPIVFNDYMFKDEKTDDCAERAQQLLGVANILSSSIDTSVERCATMEDLKLLSSKDEEEAAEAADVKPSRSLVGSYGRIASIASGAAIAIALSLSYLNIEEWFG